MLSRAPIGSDTTAVARTGHWGLGHTTAVFDVPSIQIHDGRVNQTPLLFSPASSFAQKEHVFPPVIDAMGPKVLPPF